MMRPVGGMLMYVNAFNEIQKSIDIFKLQKNEIDKLDGMVSNLETIMSGLCSVNDLDGKVEWMRNLYDGIEYGDVKEVLHSIEENSKKIKKIIEGVADIILPYDVSSLKEGNGVVIKRNQDKGNVTLNLDERYRLSSSSGLLGEYVLELGEGKNLATVDLSGENRDVTLTIDEGESGWKIGQSYRIYLVSSFDKGMTINAGDCSVEISGDELSGKSIIDLICVGKNNFIHLIK